MPRDRAGHAAPTSIAETIADDILADVGSQMGELYSALPDLIHDHYRPYQDLPLDERRALVQAVAEVIGGNRGRTVNDYEPDHIDRVDCLRCAPRGLGRRGRVRATGDDGGDRHLCGLGTLGRRWRMGPRS